MERRSQLGHDDQAFGGDLLDSDSAGLRKPVRGLHGDGDRIAAEVLETNARGNSWLVC